MIIFQEEFRKSKGKPILYKGKTLVMADPFPLPAPSVRLVCNVLRNDSPFRQGIAFDAGKKGKIVFGGERVPGHKTLVVWIDTGQPFEVIVTNPAKEVWIYNQWEDEKLQSIRCWAMGAAMIVEEIPNGRRYHCNDGEVDDDFNDLIFEITIDEILETKRR